MTDNDGMGKPNERRSLRHRTLKGGKIVLDHRSTIDCVIRNMSEEGALIRIAQEVPLPARFELLLVESDMICPVEVRWQRGRDAGLHFLDKPRVSVRKSDAE